MRKIWWLFLPLAFMAMQICLEVMLPQKSLAILHSEGGPHELLQFLMIAAAFIIAILILKQMDIKAQKWLAGWVGLAALCCLYVAGEEISWGQHFLDWTTPEFWKAYNDQQETNLRNTSSWLDQKPRLLLLIGAVTGGLLLPLAQKYAPQIVPARFAAIYPPGYLGLIAALALGVKVAEKTGESFGVVLFERASEVEEIYLFYFVLLYLIALKRRLAAG